MVKNTSRRRKRHFMVINLIKKCKNNANVSNGTSTISESKLSENLKSYGFNQQETVSNSLVGNRITDIETLSNVFSELSCLKGYNNDIFLFKDSKYGLCSDFTLKCSKCDFLKGFSSTQKTLNVPEVNARFVYGMRQIGKGFSSAYKFCATLNLPALSKSGYKKHENRLLKVVTDVAEDSMCNAAKEVAETLNRNECGVSVDGTWQLDLEVMSPYCPTCRKLQKMHKNAEYVALKADHICQCNYEGSSAEMESVGAHRIFSR
ncbi:uncharacterized protein CDAR_178071 [Caerostris darwini]|uniref:Mutator-like transposase domain-containing protein n=1 Tax=Caerostris darwini TaxID=1538125 RepID=A0AAV4X2C1_9ARAC|nr:uncharacterized protein CDAR_178071 [Caerostris darwini]